MSSIGFESPILITGASGGLGRETVSLFKEKGYLNILIPPRSELDLSDSKAVLSYFSENKPKAVLHLASVVFGLLGNMDNQMLSLVENSKININIFSAIYRHPVKYIFSANTVASYSHPYSSLPLKESDFFGGLPHFGEFGYAMSKRHATAFTTLLMEIKNIRSTNGVFTNLYGNNDRFNENSGHVIPSLISKAYSSSKQGVPLHVWGDGSAQRDFLHFKDAARAIMFCMQTENVPSLVNISSGKSVTIKQLSELIAKVANISDINFQSDKPVGIPSRVVDNSVLEGMGFFPTMPLDKGIEDLYTWFVKNKDKIRI